MLDTNILIAILGGDAGVLQRLATAAQVFVPGVALGRLIPENDIWIAAIARQHALTLVSRDDHFRDAPETALEAW